MCGTDWFTSILFSAPFMWIGTFVTAYWATLHYAVAITTGHPHPPAVAAKEPAKEPHKDLLKHKDPAKAPGKD